MSGHRILLVEDEEDTRLALEMILSDAGHEVILDSTGDRIFELVQEHLPSLIILDIFLPDNDGRYLCKALKADPVYRNIPVITISGHSEIYNAIIDFGANDIILKPFSGDTLISRVTRQLANTGHLRFYN